jgi:hypothetical protein
VLPEGLGIELFVLNLYNGREEIKRRKVLMPHIIASEDTLYKKPGYRPEGID